MGRRRGAREPRVYGVEANLATLPATGQLMHALVVELIKHLQYSRGQCCQLVDRMDAFHKVGGRQGGRATGGVRKQRRRRARTSSCRGPV